MIHPTNIPCKHSRRKGSRNIIQLKYLSPNAWKAFWTMQVKLTVVTAQIHPWCKHYWLQHKKHCTSCLMNWKEVLQRCFSYCSSPGSYISGQIFTGTSPMLPLLQLQTGADGLCGFRAENSDATQKLWHTDSTLSKPPLLTTNQLPGALHAFNPMRPPSSPSPPLCIWFYIWTIMNYWRHTLKAWLSSHASEIEYREREPTRGTCRGQRYSGKNRKPIPRGSFPENGIVLLLTCLPKTLK